MEADKQNETRMQKFMRKLRANPERWQSYCEKEKLRQKLKRERLKKIMNSDENLLNEHRRQNKLRQREARRRKKMMTMESSTQSDPESPRADYNSKYELHMAVKKVEKSLPKNMELRKMVVEELVKIVWPNAVLLKTKFDQSTGDWCPLTPPAPVKIEYVGPEPDEVELNTYNYSK